MVKILGVEIKWKDEKPLIPEKRLVVGNSYSGTDIFKSIIDKEKLEEFTQKPLEQPQESDATKSEVDEIGLPSYDTIDSLSVYDPVIDGYTNIFVAHMLGEGYSLKFDDEAKIVDLQNKMAFVDFDELLDLWVANWYRYGNAYGNMVIEGKEISGMQNVPPHYIKISSKGKFYEYEEEGGDKTKIDWRDMLHFKARPIKDYPYGKSIFESALELLEDYARFNDQFRILIEEYVAPILHTKVGPKDGIITPSDETIEQVARDVQTAKRTGTEFTTDQMVETIYVSPDRGLLVQPYLDHFKEKLLISSLIPEAALMSRSKAAAGGDSKIQMGSFYTIIRYIQKTHFETVINKHLIPMLFGVDVFEDDGTRIEVDYTQFPKFEFNPTAEWKLKMLNYELKQVNIIKTVDEVRRTLGLPELGEEAIVKMYELSMGGKDFGGERPDMADEEGGADSEQVRVDKEKGE